TDRRPQQPSFGADRLGQRRTLHAQPSAIRSVGLVAGHGNAAVVARLDSQAAAHAAIRAGRPGHAAIASQKARPNSRRSRSADTSTRFSMSSKNQALSATSPYSTAPTTRPSFSTRRL